MNFRRLPTFNPIQAKTEDVKAAERSNRRRTTALNVGQIIVLLLLAAFLAIGDVVTYVLGACTGTVGSQLAVYTTSIPWIVWLLIAAIVIYILKPWRIFQKEDQAGPSMAALDFAAQDKAETELRRTKIQKFIVGYGLLGAVAVLAILMAVGLAVQGGAPKAIFAGAACRAIVPAPVHHNHKPTPVVTPRPTPKHTPKVVATPTPSPKATPKPTPVATPKASGGNVPTSYSTPAPKPAPSPSSSGTGTSKPSPSPSATPPPGPKATPKPPTLAATYLTPYVGTVDPMIIGNLVPGDPELYALNRASLLGRCIAVTTECVVPVTSALPGQVTYQAAVSATGLSSNTVTVDWLAASSPTPTPTPTPSPTPTPTPTPSPSPTPTPTPSPTPTATPPSLAVASTSETVGQSDPLTVSGLGSDPANVYTTGGALIGSCTGSGGSCVVDATSTTTGTISYVAKDTTTGLSSNTVSIDWTAPPATLTIAPGDTLIATLPDGGQTGYIYPSNPQTVSVPYASIGGNVNPLPPAGDTIEMVDVAGGHVTKMGSATPNPYSGTSNNLDISMQYVWMNDPVDANGFLNLQWVLVNAQGATVAQSPILAAGLNTVTLAETDASTAIESDMPTTITQRYPIAYPVDYTLEDGSGANMAPSALSNACATSSSNSGIGPETVTMPADVLQCSVVVSSSEQSSPTITTYINGQQWTQSATDCSLNPTCQPASTSGWYSGAASDSADATFSWPVKSQTITFTSSPRSNPTVGGTYTPTATSSSGLPVTITVDSSSSSVCSIASGVVTFDTAGTCTLDANQAGDWTYAAAPQVQQSMTVTAGSTSASPTLAASTTSPAAGASVTFTVSNASAGTSYELYMATWATGSYSGQGSSYECTPTTSSCSVSFTASTAGSYYFEMAPSTGITSSNATNDVEVTWPSATPQSQTITWNYPAPSSSPVGSTYLPQATASSGLPVTITIDSSSTSICSIGSNGVVTFNAAGTCTIDANQAGNSSYLPAPQVQQIVNVTPPPATLAVSSTTAPAGGTITFTVSAAAAGVTYQIYAATSSSGPFTSNFDNSAGSGACTVASGGTSCTIAYATSTSGTLYFVAIPSSGSPTNQVSVTWG